MFRVDDVQGKEFRALIISTVRTCASDAKRVDEIEMEEGFFTNPKVHMYTLISPTYIFLVLNCRKWSCE